MPQSLISSQEKEPIAALITQRPTLLFWSVVGVPLAAWILMFPILCSGFFQRYCDQPAVTVQRAIYDTHKRHCDILIFGDSTAEVGMDPVIIENETHLATCNMALSAAVIPLLGTDPLDRYLSQNPRPQYLILGYSAANLSSPAVHPKEKVLDGLLMTIRYFSWTRVASDLVRNPDHILGLLNYTYFRGIEQFLKTARGVRTLVNTKSADTHFVLPGPPLTECLPFSGSHVPPDPSWIHSLRQRYSTAAGHVIVDVSPASTCIDLYQEWQNRLANVTDNEVEIYPVDSFVDDFYHLTRAGSVRYSHEIARQINTMRAQASQAVRSGVPSELASPGKPIERQ